MTKATLAEAAAAMGQMINGKAALLENGCWIYPGNRKTNKDTGTVYIKYQDHSYPIARIMYRYYTGPFDETLFVTHVCMNRACFNPDHSELKKTGDWPKPRKPKPKPPIEITDEPQPRPTFATTPTPTPVKDKGEPHYVVEPFLTGVGVSPPPTPKAAQLSEAEIIQIKDLLRLIRGLKAYANAHKD